MGRITAGILRLLKLDKSLGQGTIEQLHNLGLNFLYDFIFVGTSGPWNGENTKNCIHKLWTWSIPQQCQQHLPQSKLLHQIMSACPRPHYLLTSSVAQLSASFPSGLSNVGSTMDPPTILANPPQSAQAKGYLIHQMPSSAPQPSHHPNIWPYLMLLHSIPMFHRIYL
ncbi:hypothetical protein ZEAMMB73_Zm00001d040420 [Zea mays]|uniref:Uncharacterized protein n=1 Tax=Zea mays TaxID=4577 RepID=A0A1D6MQM5_MAIZE|nr:hypothetical protein ZEAMMB73_Zm00001d040420 [Zea mays]